MRAVLFLVVLAGLAFLSYRLWSPDSNAAGPDPAAGPRSTRLQIDGDPSAAQGQPAAPDGDRVRALRGGDFDAWVGKPHDATSEGNATTTRYAVLVAEAAAGQPDADRLGAAADALATGPEPELELRAAGFAELGARGRWAEAAAAAGRNDVVFVPRGKRAVQALIAAMGAAELEAEDATLAASAVLDLMTRGQPYLADPAVRDLFARLYQAQQDALGRSLVRPSGTWRSTSYRVGSGEHFGGIARKLGKDLGIPLSPGFLMLVNGVRDARALRAGQVLRVPSDPMRIVVETPTHTLKLFLGPILLRIYPVGLGQQGDETPEADFKVTELLRNPPWTHPRTKRYYPPGAPGNALGGYFIELGEPTGTLTGFGIHGTDQQDSIGRNESLGCIRLREGDIDELFALVARGTAVSVRR